MSRTVGVAYDERRAQWDLSGGVPAGLEALRQRITQALLLRAGEWFLDRGAGLNRNLVFGHGVRPELARSALDSTVRSEGGSEVLAISASSVAVDPDDRTLLYEAAVKTIYGNMDVREGLGDG